MLTKEQVMTMWGKAADADPDECLFAVEFARLVWEEAVRQEREACAQTVEMTASQWGESVQFAAAIRSRSEQGGEG